MSKCGHKLCISELLVREITWTEQSFGTVWNGAPMILDFSVLQSSRIAWYGRGEKFIRGFEIKGS